jgi:hypothetical protein
VHAGWNLISLPLDVSNGSAKVLFPTATSGPYEFVQSIGYVPRDTLVKGVGYWLKFDSPQNVSITGLVRNADTIPVSAGWNIIGSISVPVDTGSIVQIPPGIVQSGYFGYNGGYMAVDTIEPARGYWVKVSSSGDLVLSAAGLFAKKDRPLPLPRRMGPIR